MLVESKDKQIQQSALMILCWGPSQKSIQQHPPENHRKFVQRKGLLLVTHCFRTLNTANYSHHIIDDLPKTKAGGSSAKVSARSALSTRYARDTQNTVYNADSPTRTSSYFARQISIQQYDCSSASPY